MSLALPHLHQRANDVADHVGQETVRRDPNFEDCRELIATGSNLRPDLPATTMENRPCGSPWCCRSLRPGNAFATSRECCEIVGSHEHFRTGCGRINIQFSSPYPCVAAKKRANDRGCDPVAILAPYGVVSRAKRVRANGRLGCADVDRKT